MVAEVSTRIRHIPAEVPLGPGDGLPRVCAANLDSITTIPKRCLQQHIATLSAEKLEAVDAALKFALGLGD
jgi:mRNA interferase MazF